MNQAPSRHPRRIVFARLFIGADCDALKQTEDRARGLIQSGYFARSTKMDPNIRRNRLRFCKAKST